MLSLFSKPIVVELAAERKKISADSEASIVLLSEHPGFLALMDRLAIQKAYMESQLKKNRHEDIRQVDSLQNGIQWIEYLQDEVDKRVHKRTRAKALQIEAEANDELTLIRSAIERIVPQERE